MNEHFFSGNLFGEKPQRDEAQWNRVEALNSYRRRIRDRIRIITAVPMTIPETISVSQTARKAFEQKKYLKNFHTAKLQIQSLPLTFYNDPLQYGFSNAIL